MLVVKRICIYCDSLVINYKYTDTKHFFKYILTDNIFDIDDFISFDSECLFCSHINLNQSEISFKKIHVLNKFISLL